MKILSINKFIDYKSYKYDCLTNIVIGLRRMNLKELIFYGHMNSPAIAGGEYKYR